MYSVKDFLDKNKEYKNARDIASNIYDELKIIANEIDLDDIKKLSYQEAKDFFNQSIYTCNNETAASIREIIESKKAELYPEILGVHYFNEIKEINFISEEEKVKLDRLLSNRNIKKSEINNLDEKILEFLLEKKILEKLYVVSCGHHYSFDCDAEVIPNEKVEAFKAYWEKEAKGIETTDEEDEYVRYGCLEICCEDGNIEITNLEEFEEHLYEITYKLIKKPDRSLDNL